MTVCNPRLLEQPAPILTRRPYKSASTVTSIGTKTTGLRILSGSLAVFNRESASRPVFGPSQDSGSAEDALAFVNLRQPRFADDPPSLVGGYLLERYLPRRYRRPDRPCNVRRCRLQGFVHVEVSYHDLIRNVFSLLHRQRSRPKHHPKIVLQFFFVYLDVKRIIFRFWLRGFFWRLFVGHESILPCSDFKQLQPKFGLATQSNPSGVTVAI